MNFRLDSKEMKYILLAMSFLFIWMVFAVPYLNKSVSNNMLLSFLIFNVGVFIVIQIVFKAIILSNKISLKEIPGLILIANGVGIMSPPYLVTMSGEITNSAFLASSGSDFIAATLWQSFGAGGFFLFVLTYVISPVLLFIIAGFLLKDFVRKV